MGAILIAGGAVWLSSLVLVFALCRAARAGDAAMRVRSQELPATAVARPRVLRLVEDRPLRPATPRLRSLA